MLTSSTSIFLHFTILGCLLQPSLENQGVEQPPCFVRPQQTPWHFWRILLVPLEQMARPPVLENLPILGQTSREFRIRYFPEMKLFSSSQFPPPSFIPWRQNLESFRSRGFNPSFVHPRCAVSTRNLGNQNVNPVASVRTFWPPFYLYSSPRMMLLKIYKLFVVFM